MKRKLWALLVAVMMVATMVPAMAFANDAADAGETVTVPFEKIWNDNDSEDRPDSITVTLAGIEKTVTVEDEWETTFDVPVKGLVNGANTLEVTEESVEGYTPEITPAVVTVTEFAAPGKWDRVTDCKTTTKEFNGNCVVTKHGNEFVIWTLTKLSDNEVKAIATSVATRSDDSSFSQITEKYTYIHGNGAIYEGATINAGVIKFADKSAWSMFLAGTYTLASTTVTKATITNTLDATEPVDPEEPTVEIEGTKVWVDGNNAENSRPEAIMVELYDEDGDMVDVMEVTAPEDEEASDAWEFAFEVPEFDENGDTIDYSGYTVKETPSPTLWQYGDPEYAEDNTIINTLQWCFVIEKVWKNDTKADRPKEIKVDLTDNNGTEYVPIVITDEYVLKDNNTWYTILSVAKYDENGKILNYSVKEQPVAGYTSTVDKNMNDEAFYIQVGPNDDDIATFPGFTITNTKIGTAPADKATQTGDDFNPWVFAGVGMIALIAAAAVYFTRRQTQR